VDAETGIFMILYLDLACEQARREGRLHGIAALRQAILHGAVKRLRPKFMTVVMKRIAAPLIGGIVTSFVLELLVYLAIYEVWKWQFEMKHTAREPSEVAIRV
jgi:copper/silver efflux system protein